MQQERADVRGGLLAIGASVSRVGPALVRVASDPARLERLYQLLGPFCHEYRNRLNSVHLTLYLADPDTTIAADSDRAELERLYREALSAVEQVHQLVRPTRVAPICIGLELLVQERANAWKPRLSERGVTLELSPPTERAVGSFDPSRMSIALEGLFQWRMALAEPGLTLRLGWGLEDGSLQLEWEEVGATSRPSSDRVVEGPGLFALASLARIIAEQGGRLTYADQPRFHVAMSWPAGELELPAPIGSAAGLDRHAGRPLG